MWGSFNVCHVYFFFNFSFSSFISLSSSLFSHVLFRNPLVFQIIYTTYTWIFHTHTGYICSHTSTQVLGTMYPHKCSRAGYTCDHTSTQVLGTPVPTQALKCWVHLWPHKYSSAGYTCTHTSTQVFHISLLWVYSHSHACHPACVQICTLLRSSHLYRLTGLVVKASASRAEDPGSESRLHQDFFRVKSYQ